MSHESSFQRREPFGSQYIGDSNSIHLRTYSWDAHAIVPSKNGRNREQPGCLEELRRVGIWSRLAGRKTDEGNWVSKLFPISERDVAQQTSKLAMRRSSHD